MATLREESGGPFSFEELFAGMQDAALIIEARSGRICNANRAAAALLGYSPDELTGMHAHDIHPHEKPRLDTFLQETMDRGAWRRDDLSCRRCDGALIPSEVRSTAFVEADNAMMLVLIRDLRGEQLAEIGMSVRKIVHDMRNLLATAQLLSDRLAGHDDPKVRAGADVLSRSFERAVELCHQTLKAGHAEESRPDRVRFLLDDVVEEVAATGVLPPPLGPSLTIRSGAGMTIEADFDQFYRILLNLVRNAADAGATMLTVDAEHAEGSVHVYVSDNGPGLPEFVLANLEAAKQATGSSGLGLMIASELARGHGGRLTVAETGPGGTIFKLELPDQS